ncbi:MAG TPA: hypothetical protein VEK15_27530 [Vicinamibacteria bacterium]|nr:hypothetical protein [Vicinamibacteria bacterium]
MRIGGALTAALGLVVGYGAPSAGHSSAAEAQKHLRRACEIVWANAEPSEIEQCTKRAMAALGHDDLLRDNELKRLLIDSDRELESCRESLDQARDELARLKSSHSSKTTTSERLGHPNP